jgi:hypothetical protein
MDVVAPIQGFKKSFTFERSNDNVLGSKVLLTRVITYTRLKT